MQREYLTRLSESVQRFVLELEAKTGINIEIVRDPKQSTGGTTGQGKLAVVIEAHSIQIFAPTNDYFPDGAVRHELLHVRRFHIEGVPKLVLADSEPWDRHFSDVLGGLDNAIEHVVIVPVELQLHPERREHWEAVMRNVCSGFSDVPKDERRLAMALHWTFLRQVLPSSPLVQVAKAFAEMHNLLEMATRFADQFAAAAANKEELVRLLFRTFPDIPKHRASLEYINGTTGTHQLPIP